MKITKKQILAAIVTEFYDDLDFIENLNNITWARKAQLKNNLTTKNNEKKRIA